jgi:hypothetical protein
MPRRRACTAVAFIHQDKVLAFKGFNSNGLVTHFVAQLVDVDDLNRALEHAAAILVKQAAEAKAGQIQFSQVLAGQALIGCEQNDLVGVGFFCRSGNSASTVEYSHAAARSCRCPWHSRKPACSVHPHQTAENDDPHRPACCRFSVARSSHPATVVGLLKYQSRYISVKSRDRYWKYFMLRTVPSSLLRCSVMAFQCWTMFRS